MSTIRLILAIHNHQPVGNFDGVFEDAFNTAYLPFLQVWEDYGDLPFCLHLSGPLLDWLSDRKPNYLERLQRLARAHRLEPLGGAYAEPILTMIPHRDRVGQLRESQRMLTELYGQAPRGVWIAERVWEPHLVSALAEAGVEYTLLDDFHFQRAGLEGRDLLGYYLTEDEGRLLKVFPVDERLRYVIPFEEPHSAYLRLRELADTQPGAVVVFGDDGEKFGSWPETYDHVYVRGWMRRFCDMLVANRDWLEVTTFSRVVDSQLPLGKVYLPESSYREMTEWVLPPALQQRLAQARTVLDRLPPDQADLLRPFFRPAGFWRNFRVKYPEADEMIARMMAVSNRLAQLESRPDADPDYLEAARLDLYRGQCNCPYWHGAFGGLYLPHLRNAIYEHLIAADLALDAAQGRPDTFVEAIAADWNFDARQEIRLANDRMILWLRPAQGGHLYGFDDLRARFNLLATLDRRPEPYHDKILRAIREGTVVDPKAPSDEINNLQNKIILKSADLDVKLIYDTTPRKALVDHFFAAETTLGDLIAGRSVDLGDFATGTHLAKLIREPGVVTLVMERVGVVKGHAIGLRKQVRLEAGSPALSIRYDLDELPPGMELRFGVEINLAGMAGHADDRLLIAPDQRPLGRLDARLDLAELGGIAVRDAWRDARIDLSWSRPAAVWSFPIETVSQSEGGFEAVYQSTALIPRWVVQGDRDRRWSVEMTWTLGPAGPEPLDLDRIDLDRIHHATGAALTASRAGVE